MTTWFQIWYDNSVIVYDVYSNSNNDDIISYDNNVSDDGDNLNSGDDDMNL